MTKTLTAAEDIAGIKYKLEEAMLNGGIDVRTTKLFEKRINKTLRVLSEKIDQAGLDPETKKKAVAKFLELVKDLPEKIAKALSDKETYKKATNIIAVTLQTILGVIIGILGAFMPGVTTFGAGLITMGTMLQYADGIIAAIQSGSGVSGIVTAIITKLLGGSVAVAGIAVGLIGIVKIILVAAIFVIMAKIIEVFLKGTLDALIFSTNLVNKFRNKVLKSLGASENEMVPNHPSRQEMDAEFNPI